MQLILLLKVFQIKPAANKANERHHHRVQQKESKEGKELCSTSDAVGHLQSLASPLSGLRPSRDEVRDHSSSMTPTSHSFKNKKVLLVSQADDQSKTFETNIWTIMESEN